MAFLRSLLFIVGTTASMVLAAQETKAASCVSNFHPAVLPIYCPETAVVRRHWESIATIYDATLVVVVRGNES